MVDEMKSVTVVGLNYSPELTGIAPYTTKFAEHLSCEGYRVRVVTGFPHYPAWEVDPVNVGLPTETSIGHLSLGRVRHYVPSNPSMLRRIRMELSFGIRAVFARWGRPDVVVSISPSLLASGLVLLRSKLSRHRPAVGIWVQDIYTRGIIETTDVPGIGARVSGILEGSILRGADSVVVIHSRFKQYLTESLGVDAARIHISRNWTHVSDPDDSDVKTARAKLGWNWDGVIVLHAGNMGAKQGLENVVAAAKIAEVRGDPIHFVLLGDGNQRARLEFLASGLQNIHFVDPLPDSLFSAALSAADILLVNEKAGVTEMAVPSKLTTYFSSNRPVLAATEPDSTTAEELRNSGGGVVVPPGSPEGLVDAVALLAEDWDRCSSFAAAGLRYRDEVLSAPACLGSHKRWVDLLASTRA